MSTAIPNQTRGPVARSRAIECGVGVGRSLYFQLAPDLGSIFMWAADSHFEFPITGAMAMFSDLTTGGTRNGLSTLWDVENGPRRMTFARIDDEVMLTPDRGRGVVVQVSDLARALSRAGLLGGASY